MKASALIRRAPTWLLLAVCALAFGFLYTQVLLDAGAYIAKHLPTIVWGRPAPLR